jgi:hypothetical protein
MNIEFLLLIDKKDSGFDLSRFGPMYVDNDMSDIPIMDIMRSGIDTEITWPILNDIAGILIKIIPINRIPILKGIIALKINYRLNAIVLYLFARPTPRFTRAGQMWVWSRGAVCYGADVVGGCKELSAGKGSCLCYYYLSARILYSRRRLERHASRRRVQQFVGQKCGKLQSATKAKNKNIK